jgi:UDPglucose--hexose-1-phosphate uridylyltransferase
VAERRTDWLTGRSIIVAEHRAQRPNEFASNFAAGTGAQTVANLALAEIGLTDVVGVPSCPFCVGNESKTPPAVYQQLDAEGRWQVRVVPNMYPAVTPTVGTAAADARGAHEVIIESARHVDRASSLSTQELRQVLEAYANRLCSWRDDGRFSYGLVFKNQGPRAGASIGHLHSQFIALPDVPPAVEAEMHRAERDFRRHDRCPYCRLLERERSFAERIVLDRNGYVAFCPFASLQPHEVWLLPDRHETSFEQLSSPDAADRLAKIVQDLLKRLELIVPNAAYNMLLRTAPWKAGCDNWCHWRMEFLPRVNAIAGFEIASGVHINPLAPEKAARQIRSL